MQMAPGTLVLFSLFSCLVAYHHDTKDLESAIVQDLKDLEKETIGHGETLDLERDDSEGEGKKSLEGSAEPKEKNRRMVEHAARAVSDQAASWLSNLQHGYGEAHKADQKMPPCTRICDHFGCECSHQASTPVVSGTDCAREGGTCQCTGLVRLGVGTRWSQWKRVAGAIACTNTNFGGDPAPYTSKTCQCTRSPPTHQSLLLYITSHLSKSHLEFTQQCLSGMIQHSPLLRRADTMLYASPMDQNLDNTWLQSLASLNTTRIHVSKNPGYQAGAISAMRDAVKHGWFKGYDWVIRLNPDVMIYNTSKLEMWMEDPSVDGIFGNCNYGWTCTTNCTRGQVHTDFIMFRPRILTANSFQSQSYHSESQATKEFQHVIAQGRDRWISPRGKDQQCRIRTEDIEHSHDMSRCIEKFGPLAQDESKHEPRFRNLWKPFFSDLQKSIIKS